VWQTPSWRTGGCKRAISTEIYQQFVLSTGPRSTFSSLTRIMRSAFSFWGVTYTEPNTKLEFDSAIGVFFNGRRARQRHFAISFQALTNVRFTPNNGR
jgi:hypothetical protein